MHPLLQPAIWIGEVLHGSPLLPTDLVPELKGIDPLGDIMPISFIALNVIAIGALTTIAELRTALNIWLLAAFINYIGCGLEGTKDLADYNLALNDDVRGCPTYEQVRQPSMASFDPVKYQGRWYEQAFHDWTQFGDVWDTTLDVELSADGGRWLDDFALRGPAPKAAPLSWDKSPVANGAHYFLYGKLDYPGKQEGVIQESGFGVTFPNYIVDVQKDPNTGEYTEAIQFQCLERGGVRIFEGINFIAHAKDEQYGNGRDVRPSGEGGDGAVWSDARADARGAAQGSELSADRELVAGAVADDRLRQAAHLARGGDAFRLRKGGDGRGGDERRTDEGLSVRGRVEV